MTVLVRSRGAGAHLQRHRMLRELHDAGLITYIGLSAGSPREFLVEVDKMQYRLTPTEVGPFCAGIALASGHSRNVDLPVMRSLLAPESDGEHGDDLHHGGATGRQRKAQAA